MCPPEGLGKVDSQIIQGLTGDTWSRLGKFLAFYTIKSSLRSPRLDLKAAMTDHVTSTEMYKLLSSRCVPFNGGAKPYSTTSINCSHLFNFALGAFSPLHSWGNNDYSPQSTQIQVSTRIKRPDFLRELLKIYCYQVFVSGSSPDACVCVKPFLQSEPHGGIGR